MRGGQGRRCQRVRRFPHPRHGDRRARFRGALQVLRRVCRRDDRAVRDRSRIFPQRLRRHRQGRRAGGDADRRFRRRRARARLPAGHLPVDRRLPADGFEPGLHLAGVRRRQPLGADRHDHRREFHRRDRHRDLRRLSLGAVQSPLHTATQYALLTALAAVGRTISRPARATSPKWTRLAAVLRHQRAHRAAEPVCSSGCSGAAISTLWRNPRASSWTIARTASAAGSPPTACPRRDSRARRRPARHAQAASPSRRRRAAGR